jgi:hypothetical protein
MSRITSRRREKTSTAAIMAIFALLLSAAAGAIACKGQKSGAPGPEPRPFALTATEDVAHRMSKHIGAAGGGTVQTVDAQGTRYRLTIPQAALLSDADIVLTPLTSISGVPGQTIHYGVDIQPAGTRLYELARLEIIPTTALPKDVYWLETEGPTSRLLARPGFVAFGKPGMLLAHFSGGSVVAGSAQTSGAVHVAGDGPGAVGSRAWLEWMRNVIQQDYQSGNMDKSTYDVKSEAVNRRLDEVRQRELEDKLEAMSEAAKQGLDKADTLADRGDLNDAQAIHDLIMKALEADAQHQYLGVAEETELTGKIGAVFFKWYAGVLHNCAMRHVDPDVLVGLERDLQLLGYQSSPADFAKCSEVSGAQNTVAKSLTSSNGDRSKRAARRALMRRAAQRVATYANGIK